MPDDKDNLDDFQPDQQKRIEKLKRKANEIAGGEMTTMETEDINPDISEAFWQQIVAYESAGFTTHYKQLRDANVELTLPEELDDSVLKSKLWEMIEKLASMRVFIRETDHLSDRELYSLLLNDTLHEQTPAIGFDQYSAWNIDLVSSGSEEDTYLYLKYYADEDWRKQWLSDFPDYVMPPHKDPPYNRDAFLPKVTYAVPDHGEFPSELYDLDDDDELETKM